MINPQNPILPKTQTVATFNHSPHSFVAFPRSPRRLRALWRPTSQRLRADEEGLNLGAGGSIRLVCANHEGRRLSVEVRLEALQALRQEFAQSCVALEESKPGA